MRVQLGALVAVVLALCAASPASAASRDIWVSPADIAAAPTSGPAWATVSADAEDAKSCTPSLTGLNDDCDVHTLAAAYKAVKLNDASSYQAVESRIAQVPATSVDRALELARNITSYVIAADVIDLPTRNPGLNSTFSNYLAALAAPDSSIGTPSLTTCHEARPNNWGAMCGAALAAIDAYLGDAAALDQVYAVEKAWAGDRTSTYQASAFGFNPIAASYGPSGSTESTLVGINPVGSTTGGHDTDGLQPDDERRATAAPFAWPLVKSTSYPWESLQGRLVAAQILTRAGRDMYQVADQALRRAVDFLYRTQFNTGTTWPAEGDDLYLMPIVDQAYATSYQGTGSDWTGKNMGYTNWVLGGAATTPGAPCRARSRPRARLRRRSPLRATRTQARTRTRSPIRSPSRRPPSRPA